MDSDIKTRVTSVHELHQMAEEGEDCLVVIYSSDEHQIGKRYVLEDGPVLLGRGSDSHIVLENDSVSRRHARIEPRSGKWYISDLESTNGTYVNDSVVHSHQLRRGDQVKIGDTILKYLSGSDVEAQYHETIYRMTICDGLTGINNKRYLLESMDREIPRARRHERPLSMMMFDIDHFKNINDTFGHLAGDHVLKELAGLVRARLRPDDVFARYGGEEFAVILPETTRDGAHQIAETIRALVEGHHFQFENESIPVTISLGVTQYLDDFDALGFIKAADERLYEAKRGGRNRVCG